MQKVVTEAMCIFYSILAANEIRSYAMQLAS